ncbi:hypothetical protein D3C75_967450 [compost metagenome]
MAFIRLPAASSIFAVLIACGTPLRRVSKVSTSRVTPSGITLAYASKASCSLAKLCTQEWAWVPLVGMPNFLPASMFEVAWKPPT